MNVSFNTAASGMRTAVTRHAVTAHDVANVNTPGFEERTVEQAETRPRGVRVAGINRRPNLEPARSNTSLVEETKEQILNKNTFGANARVFKAQDEMTQNVIDLLA